ncbi:MAG: C2H2-type zinc finger protein [Sphaerochaetaceae bacterium]|jgi:hypothetical protein|nr:C2H2-type zinc finger protein [Sphaerochaetaceae bacterium]
MRVICEICNEYIAQVEPGGVTTPMLGKMFKTPDGFHGYDPPFLPETEWEDMRCGYCNQRPFSERDGFLTDEGYIKIQPTVVEDNVIPSSVLEEFEVEVDNVKVEFEQPVFTCEVCGKICKGKGGFGSHMRTHAKK